MTDIRTFGGWAKTVIFIAAFIFAFPFLLIMWGIYMIFWLAGYYANAFLTWVKLLPVILIVLIGINIFLTDGRTIYLPNCVVMAPVVVQNKSGEDIMVMVFGKVEDGEVKRIGTAPISQIKGIEITDGIEREEM